MKSLYITSNEGDPLACQGAGKVTGRSCVTNPLEQGIDTVRLLALSRFLDFVSDNLFEHGSTTINEFCIAPVARLWRNSERVPLSAGDEQT